MGAGQRKCFDKIANNETVKGWGCRQFEEGARVLQRQSGDAGTVSAKLAGC